MSLCLCISDETGHFFFKYYSIECMFSDTRSIPTLIPDTVTDTFAMSETHLYNYYINIQHDVYIIYLYTYNYITRKRTV